MRDRAWGPWALVAATFVPVALAVQAGVRVLAGAVDATSVTGWGPGYPPVDALPNLRDRLGWMLSAVGFDTALLCATVAAVCLAAARRAPGAWRVTGSARVAAATVSGFAALVGVALTGVVLLDAYGPPTPLRQALSAPAPEADDGTITFAVVSLGTPFSDAAAALVPAGICAAAAWLLLWREPQA